LAIRKPENLQPTTILYRRREEGGVSWALVPPSPPQQLPCFEVPRHEGGSLSDDGHPNTKAKGPTLLFSGVITCPHFQFTGM